MRKKATAAPTTLVTEEETEEEYPLIYNMWVENMTIHAYDGATVILQTGKPSSPPKPPGT